MLNIKEVFGCLRTNLTMLQIDVHYYMTQIYISQIESKLKRRIRPCKTFYGMFSTLLLTFLWSTCVAFDYSLVTKKQCLLLTYHLA